MSTIAVLGAGIVGRAAVGDLVRRGYDVLVSDADVAAARSTADEFEVRHARVDAADRVAVDRFLADADVVVSAVPYGYGPALAAAAVAAGCHYLDFGGNPAVVAEQLRLDDEAVAAGVAVVPDCGLAPGVANVLAYAAVEALGPGPVDRLALRVGALPVEPRGILGYQLAFSPGGLINEYAEPCEVLQDGRYATVEPLTGFEEVDWPDWGPLEAFHTAGGSSSLPRRLEGRVTRLDYKTLRYPGHGKVFRALYELGLFSEEPRRYGDADAEVSPRDVLSAALAEHLPRGEDDVVLVRTWAEARRDGERRRRGYQIVDRHDGRFSALARTTAFPATALAHLLITGGVTTRGAVTMDHAVNGADLVPELRSTGIAVEDWAPTD